MAITSIKFKNKISFNNIKGVIKNNKFRDKLRNKFNYKYKEDLFSEYCKLKYDFEMNNLNYEKKLYFKQIESKLKIIGKL